MYLITKKKVNKKFVAQVFAFANKYRGAYSNSLYHAVCPFYCDFNGYQVKKRKENTVEILLYLVSTVGLV